MTRGTAANRTASKAAQVSAITGVARMRRWSWRFLGTLDRLPPSVLLLLGTASIVALGAVDHLTGPLISLTIFYLAPVAVIAWVLGPTPGFVLSLFAATTWALADRLGPRAAPYTPVSYWNDVVLVGVFLVVVVLANRLKTTWAWEDELLYDVQRRLLPSSFPPVAGYEIACRWHPAGAVGGDYYDVIERPDGKIALCIADVSGKGVPAALVMSNVQATVRALTDECLSPDRLATRLNRSLASILRPGSFVTMVYAVHDPVSGALEYVNAGHPFPLLARADGRVERLATSGPVLAVLPSAAYPCRQIDMRPGDRLVLFTDGLSERTAESGEEFGERRLADLASANRHAPANDMCDQLMNAVGSFAQGPFDDDVTILVVAATGTIRRSQA